MRHLSDSLEPGSAAEAAREICGLNKLHTFIRGLK